MRLLYFTTKDLAFMGIMMVVCYIVAFLTIKFLAPLIRIPGSKFIASAFFVSIVLSIMLGKVKKMGTLSLFSLIFGAICGFIVPAEPILFPMIVTCGFIAELVTRTFYKDYANTPSLVLVCAVNKGAIVLFTAGVPPLFGYTINLPPVYYIIGLVLLVTALGAAGGFVGAKIINEIRKAGIIK